MAPDILLAPAAMMFLPLIPSCTVFLVFLLVPMLSFLFSPRHRKLKQDRKEQLAQQYISSLGKFLKYTEGPLLVRFGPERVRSYVAGLDQMGLGPSGISTACLHVAYFAKQLAMDDAACQCICACTCHDSRTYTLHKPVYTPVYCLLTVCMLDTQSAMRRHRAHTRGKGRGQSVHCWRTKYKQRLASSTVTRALATEALSSATLRPEVFSFLTGYLVSKLSMGDDGKMVEVAALEHRHLQSCTRGDDGVVEGALQLSEGTLELLTV